jgi:hypothetical protein
MISTKTDRYISIRSIQFNGASDIEGQARGENTITVNYNIQTKVVDQKTLRHRHIVVAEKTVKFNLEFADQELYEALIATKVLAVSLIKERHTQEEKEIEDAIAKIGRDTTDKPEDIGVQAEAQR